MNPRRLYRSRHDRQLAGVAGGMAEYLEVDPTVVRLLWILSVFLGGFTILLYVILAFIVPLEPVAAPAPGSWPPAAPAGGVPQAPAPGSVAAADSGMTAGADPAAEVRRDRRGGLYLGILLVVFGAIAMVNVVVPGFAGNGALWAALVVAAGVALVVGSSRRTATQP